MDRGRQKDCGAEVSWFDRGEREALTRIVFREDVNQMAEEII